MTPAVKFLEKARVPFKLHQYNADSDDDVGWGEAAAQALGLDPSSVFKTLVLSLQGAPGKPFAVAVVPVAQRVDFRAVCAALGAKKSAMADPADA